MAPELRWGVRTYLMGILNLTADSFSGDGLLTAGRDAEEIVDAALAQGRSMVMADNLASGHGAGSGGGRRLVRRPNAVKRFVAYMKRKRRASVK